MSTKITTPLPVTQIQVGEIRAKLIGAAPQGWARVAFMNQNGKTMGDTTFNAWSRESWELLIRLSESVERDLSSWMEHPDNGDPWSGPEYEAPDNDEYTESGDLNFGSSG